MQSKQYAEQYFNKNYRKLNIDRSRLLPNEEALKAYGFCKIIYPERVRLEAEIVLDFNDFMICCKEQGITSLFVTKSLMNKSNYKISQKHLDEYKYNSYVDGEVLCAMADIWNSELSAINDSEFAQCGYMCLYAADARGLMFTTYLSYNPIRDSLLCEDSITGASDVLFAFIENMSELDVVNDCR